MKKLTHKRKKHLERRSKKGLKNKKRDRKFRLKKIGSNSYLHRLSMQQRNLQEAKQKKILLERTEKAPFAFSIQNNSHGVISFVYKIKKYACDDFAGYTVILDLERVKDIDVGAISLLLSVVDELSQFKVKGHGTFPRDERCRIIFEKSGFLSHMKTISARGLSKPSNEAGLILERGRNTTKQEEIGGKIKEAVRLLTGNLSHYPPMYSLLLELSGNSVEHAYPLGRDEHWLFAMNYNEEERKAVFCYVDNGVGILNTLKRRYSKMIYETLKLTSDGQILARAFDKKYNSRHKDQVNRNKGLPRIKSIVNNTFVSNLMVITNQVSYNIAQDKWHSLQDEYSGTFYYWELNLNNLEKWSQIAS